MKAAVSEVGSPPVFDFFEIDERPVVVNRKDDVSWIWSKGDWQRNDGLIAKCYAHGHALSEDAFVQRFPYAALALLELQQEH